VDVKEATVECSWPLIYYVIDDYEDTFEQLMLRENEHLCVELAVTLPSSNTSTTAVSTISKSRSGIAQQLHQQDTHGNHETGSHRRLSVGSQSRSANKITLFQGMVGYTNLLGIYQQKASSKVGRRFKFGPHTVPTEFIVMRGPGGRGHAQVSTSLAMERNSPYVEQRHNGFFFLLCSNPQKGVFYFPYLPVNRWDDPLGSDYGIQHWGGRLFIT